MYMITKTGSCIQALLHWDKDSEWWPVRFRDISWTILNNVAWSTKYFFNLLIANRHYVFGPVTPVRAGGEIHVEFHVTQQSFSNMASDWLAAVLSANQMPGWNIFVN